MKRLLPLIFTLVSISTLSIAASAATFTVTKAANSNDGVCDGDCSLREAVAVSGTNDTVTFSGSLVGQTFVLGGDDIEITHNITIDGNLDGVNVAFLSGENNTRHFFVHAGAQLRLINMILVNGDGTGTNVTGVGGSICSEPGGNVDLDRVAVRSNTAIEVGALRLAGSGTHRITNSSITSNRAQNITAILVNGSLYMSNTTIRNNKLLNTLDPSGYGALAIFGNTVVIRNSTIAENEAKRGGGIFAGSSVPNTINLGNTIVAQNSATVSGEDIGYSDPVLFSAGGNLISSMDTIPGGIFNQTKDVTGVNPKLAPTNSLQGGHPVETFPLQAGSPAINGGINSLAVEPFSNTPLANDERGSGFPRLAGSSVDKGAFEDQSNSASLYVSKLADTDDSLCDTDCSLREAVEAAGIDTGTDTITMAANVFGTITLSGEIPVQNQTVNIIGYPTISSDTLVVSGNDSNRAFEFENSNVTLSGFTVADGNGQGSSQPFGGGAIRVFGGNMTLNQMIFRDNTVGNTEFGGAISTQSVNVVRIMNSLFTDNRANSLPALAIDAGVTYITNTTISGNSDPLGGDCGGALSVGGSLYMRNSTVTLNRCAASTTGAGVVCGSGPGVICNFGNSIIANNTAAATPDLLIGGGATLQSVGGNLIETLTGYNNAIFNAPNDQIGVGANLLVLADNGGAVPTHALGMGSAAINTGWNPNATDPFSSQPLTTDARGAGYSRINGGVVDKGAFEAIGPTAASVTIGGRLLIAPGGKGLGNATVILSGPNGMVAMALTNTFGYYQFPDVEVGHTYVISVSSKRYTFEPRLLNLSEEILDLDLVAVQ